MTVENEQLRLLEEQTHDADDDIPHLPEERRPLYNFYMKELDKCVKQMRSYKRAHPEE